MNRISKQYVMEYCAPKVKINKYCIYKKTFMNCSYKNFSYYKFNIFDIPIAITDNGAKMFGIRNMHHRLIGPAYIDTSKNIMLYYINGEFDVIKSALRETSFRKNIL